MTRKQKPFGEVLRELRLAKGFSLRNFAVMANISPTYLSRVEQGKIERQPTADRVQRIAELLGENPDELIALAGRVPQDLPEIIQSEPTEIPELLREVSGLSPEQLRKLTKQAKKLKEKGT